MKMHKITKQILIIAIYYCFIGGDNCYSATVNCDKELESICPSSKYTTHQAQQECKQINIIAFSTECIMTEKERIIKQRRYDIIKKRQENTKKQQADELEEKKQNNPIVDFSNIDLANQEEVDKITQQTLKHSRKDNNLKNEGKQTDISNNTNAGTMDDNTVKHKTKKQRTRRNATNIFTANNQLSNTGLYLNGNFDNNNYIYTPFGITPSNNKTIAKIDYTGGIKATDNDNQIEYYQEIYSQCKNDINALCNNDISLDTQTKSHRYITKCIRILKKNRDYISLKCNNVLYMKKKQKKIINNSLKNTEQINNIKKTQETFIDKNDVENDNITTEELIDEQEDDKELKELEMYLFNDYDEFREKKYDNGLNITMTSGEIVKESQINRLIEKYKDRYEQMSEEGKIAFINKYFDNRKNKHNAN